MTTEAALVACIRENPNASLPLMVFADWLDDTDRPGSAKLVRMGVCGPPQIKGGGYGYGYGGDGGGYGYGYGGGGDGDGGDGDDGDGGGYGYGDGGDGGDGDGDGFKTRLTLSEAYAMQEGLSIITVASGYYPFVLVGWAKVTDMFVELHGCRVIRRYGSKAQLGNIAKKGPQRDTELLDPSGVECIGIAMIGRVIPCDEAAWAKQCPRPESF